MLILDGANDKIQVVTGSTGTIEVHASWVDNNAGAITPSRTNTAAISTATTTDVVAAPGASKQRNVKHLNIMNDHASSSMALDVQHTDGTNVETLWGGTLLAQESLVFDASGRWTLYDANGLVKASAYPTATQTDMEAATSNVLFVTPAAVQWHPGVAKWFARVSGDGATLRRSYNVTSQTDNGTGDLTVTIATDFSDANWACWGLVDNGSTSLSVCNVKRLHISSGTIAAGTIRFASVDNTATTNVVKDPGEYCLGGFGDQ